ncbi:MFS transporter [Ramlibacter sp. AW1]|uniref:MFS transporter n=1 Tax=Ramlibacter aurantiacus TaxID=2801330 RepID=A0A936ZMP8_9BURK|nr:MFS transporter [Ramlibacter aurantiacus]MBL0420115.1 MFS transporter [Ramlibacter aurantiacus]
MLLAFTAGFAMSQAFRTLAAIVAPPLQQSLGLTPGQLGVFAGVFHLAFGSLQIVTGVGIDIWGARRTMLAVFPLAVVGALVAAGANGYGQLVLGQALIGVGCAPAFVVCTVFIARRFPAERFAAVSGAVLGLGSVGMLLTGTPVAWLVAGTSWRAAYGVLAAASALAWLAVWRVVREDPPAADQRPAVLPALRGYVDLLRLPHTWGILALALVTYASFLTLRGLWLGPLLVERHTFTLVSAGHVALAVSLIAMVGPPIFGRLDPGPLRRRRWIVGYTMLTAGLFMVLAASRRPVPDVALVLAITAVTGYIVLQYADLRSAYPTEMAGRAMALFTMAMFLGVGLVQWLTGLAASAAQAVGWEPYGLVFTATALLLAGGTAVFVRVPVARA